MREPQSVIVQQGQFFLMKMLRIHLEDPLERTSLLLLAGGCPQSSPTAASGMSADTAEKIKCYLPPRVGIWTPISPGRIGNESARISRAKETRRSVTSPWQISALETARHGCTAAPCPSIALAMELLKQMCIYCFPKHFGNGKEKRESKFCHIFKFQLEIRVLRFYIWCHGVRCTAPLHPDQTHYSKTPSYFRKFQSYFKNVYYLIIANAYCSFSCKILIKVTPPKALKKPVRLQLAPAGRHVKKTI